MSKKNILLILFVYPIFSAFPDGIDDITEKTTELTNDIFSFSDSAKYLGFALLILTTICWILFPKVRTFFNEHWKVIGAIIALWIVVSYFGENIKTAISESFNLQKLVKK